MIAACIISNPSSGGSSPYGPPEAAFSPDDITIGTGTNQAFLDHSTNNPTSWQWFIGGVLFSIAQNPSYLFSFPGYFGISLIATNSYGASSPVEHTVHVI